MLDYLKGNCKSRWGSNWFGQEKQAALGLVFVLIPLYENVPNNTQNDEQ